MIDFATLKGVAIPEGTVTKIESGGAVLWSAKTDATLTITTSGMTGYAHVTIDGVQYSSAATVTVPVGTVVSCWAKESTISGTGGIDFNGERVAVGTYDYTVTGNAAIMLTGGMGGSMGSITFGYIAITEE